MASRSSDSHQSAPSAGSHAGSSMPAAASLSPPQKPPSAVRLPEGWNPWTDRRFKSHYVALIDTMGALDVRKRCFGAELITKGENEFLATKELQCGRVAHNEYLMGRLECRAKSFPGFVQVLDGMGPALEEICGSLASMLPSSPPEDLHQDSIASAYHPSKAASKPLPRSGSGTMASGVDYQSQLPSSAQRFGRPHHEHHSVQEMAWCEPTMFERGPLPSTNVQAPKVLPKAAGSLRPTVRNAVCVRFPSILPAAAAERIMAHPSFPRLEGFTPYPTTIPSGDGNDMTLLILLYLREPQKGRGNVDREEQVKSSFTALIRKMADLLQLATPRKEYYVKHVVSTSAELSFCAVVSAHCLDVLSAVNLQIGRPMINAWSDIMCSPSWPAALHSDEFHGVCDKELRSCIAPINIAIPSASTSHAPPLTQRPVTTAHSTFDRDDRKSLNLVSTSSSTASSVKAPTDVTPFLTDTMQRGLSMGSSIATAASRDSALPEEIVFRHPLLRRIQVCAENEAWIEVIMEPLFQLCKTIDIASVVQRCVENNILTADEQLFLQRDFAGMCLQWALMSTLATEKPPELVESFISAVRPYRNLAPEAIAMMEQRLHYRKAQSDKPDVFKLFRQESDSQQSPSEVLSGDVDGFQRLFKHVHGLCGTWHSGMSTVTSDSSGSFNDDMLECSPPTSSSGKGIYALALIGRSGCVMDFLQNSINLSSEQVSTISKSSQGGSTMVAVALNGLLLLAVLLTSPCSNNADCRLAHIAINSTRHAVLLLGQDDLSPSRLCGQADGSHPRSVFRTVQGALRDFAVQQLPAFEDSPSLTLYVRSTSGQHLQEGICDNLRDHLKTAMSSLNNNTEPEVKPLARAQTEGLQQLGQRLVENWVINWLVQLSISVPMCILKSELSDSASHQAATSETGSCQHTSAKNGERIMVNSFSICAQQGFASVAEMVQQLQQSCGCLQFLSEWTGNIFAVTVLTKSPNDTVTVSNKLSSFGANSATTPSQPTYSSLHCNASYSPSRQSLVLLLHTEGWNVVGAGTECSTCLNLVCRQLFVCAALSDVIVVAAEDLEGALQNISSALKMACKILNWPIDDGNQSAALIKDAHFFNAQLCVASGVPDAMPLKLFPVLAQLVPSGTAEPYPILHGRDGHARLSECIASQLESILSHVQSPALLRNMLLLCSTVLAGDAHCLDVAEIAINHARDVHKSCAVLLQSGTLESDDIPVSNTTLTMADGQPLVVTDERLKTDKHLRLMEGKNQEDLDSLKDTMESIVATIAHTKGKASHRMLPPEEVFHEIKHLMSQLCRRRKDRALSYLNSKYVNCLTSLKQFEASLADLNSFFAEGMVPSESGIWKFCGERCDQCCYFCIQPKHGTDVPHDCLDRSDRAHLCITDCAACVREGVDPEPCIKAAGHRTERIDGDHLCEPENDLDVHRCKQQCVFKTEDPVLRCQSFCRLRVGHSGSNHPCGLSDAEHADLKRCCKPCSGPGCAEKCCLPKNQPHSPNECNCGTQGCSDFCSCGKQCHERIVHLHRPRPHADLEIEHHCQDEHSCPDMCSEQGVCVLKYPRKEEDPDLFKAIGNYARKLRCSRKIRMGKLQHQSSRPHRCDNDPEDHYCDNVCTVCGNSCLERAGHVGPCALKHGRVANNDELLRLQALVHDESVVREWSAGACLPSGIQSAGEIEATHGQQATFHKFTSQMHPCPEKCQASTSCVEACECAFGHSCSAMCPDDCPREGDCLGKHIHSSSVLHHCGRSHRCSDMCERPGTCFLQQAISAEPPEGSLPVSSVGNAYRLLCGTNFPKGYSNHKHLANGHSCEKPHTCDKYCGLCHKSCTLPYEHSGICDTDHGAIVDIEQLGLVIRRQDDSMVELTAGLTCANLCQAAGPSHKHERYCDCSTRVGWVAIDFYHHRSSNLIKDPVDEVSHRILWERIMGFKDPHPDAHESEDFSRCPQQCKEKEHSEDSDRPYCDAGLFHPKLDPANYSHIPGYVSQEKHPHHYPCTNHKCQGLCQKMDSGKRCEETCKWDADHTSRDEKQCVCWKEKHH